VTSSSDPKGGSRWAPIVVFGGIVAIGATCVTIVLGAHCGREKPYLDPQKIEWNQRDVSMPPEPIRPTKDMLLQRRPTSVPDGEASAPQ